MDSMDPILFDLQLFLAGPVGDSQLKTRDMINIVEHAHAALKRIAKKDAREGSKQAKAAKDRT